MDNQTFHYTYSAEQQQEIRDIRQKYLPPETNKMEQLRRLDKSVGDKATLYSLICGILGALVLGGGMSLCLVASSGWMLPGILIGVIGIGLTAMAYPLYLRVLYRERQRVAPEILRLTDELMK